MHSLDLEPLVRISTTVLKISVIVYYIDLEPLVRVGTKLFFFKISVDAFV